MEAICLTDSFDSSKFIDRTSELTKGKKYTIIEHYGIFEHSQWGGNLYIKNDRGHETWYRLLSGLYQGEPNFKIIDPCFYQSS